VARSIGPEKIRVAIRDDPEGDHKMLGFKKWATEDIRITFLKSRIARCLSKKPGVGSAQNVYRAGF
jgi:hypothetical protein